MSAPLVHCVRAGRGWIVISKARSVDRGRRQTVTKSARTLRALVWRETDRHTLMRRRCRQPHRRGTAGDEPDSRPCEALVCFASTPPMRAWPADGVSVGPAARRARRGSRARDAHRECAGNGSTGRTCSDSGCGESYAGGARRTSRPLSSHPRHPSPLQVRHVSMQ